MPIKVFLNLYLCYWLCELLRPSQTDVQKKALKILHLKKFSIVLIYMGKSVEQLRGLLQMLICKNIKGGKHGRCSCIWSNNSTLLTLTSHIKDLISVHGSVIYLYYLKYFVLLSFCSEYIQWQLHIFITLLMIKLLKRSMPPTRMLWNVFSISIASIDDE